MGMGDYQGLQGAWRDQGASEVHRGDLGKIGWGGGGRIREAF